MRPEAAADAAPAAPRPGPPRPAPGTAAKPRVAPAPTLGCPVPDPRVAPAPSPPCGERGGMSAAASAEMIETPPVLNFEEIDYKEIEVEEVSEGPAVPLAPRAQPAWPRHADPAVLLPGTALRRGPRRLRGCAGMPRPPRCT